MPTTTAFLKPEGTAENWTPAGRFRGWALFASFQQAVNLPQQQQRSSFLCLLLLLLLHFLLQQSRAQTAGQY